MDILPVAREFGVTVAILLTLMGAIGLAMRWFARRVAEPLLAAHLAFLKKLQETLSVQSITLNQIATVQGQAVEQIQELKELVLQQNQWPHRSG